MMRSDAGLHPDQARRHIRKTSLYLATRPLLTQHDRTAIIEAYDVERVLPNIDTNYGDRILCCCSGHCVLLVWAPLASLSLAGQEHGRTIPLADVGGVETSQRSSLPRHQVCYHFVWKRRTLRET